MKRVFKNILFFNIIVIFTIVFSVEVNADDYMECLYENRGVDITITRDGNNLDYQFEPEEYELESSNIVAGNFDNLSVNEGSCPTLYIRCSTEKILSAWDHIAGALSPVWNTLPKPGDEYIYYCVISNEDDNNFWHEYLGDEPAVDQVFGINLNNPDEVTVDQGINDTFDCEGDNGLLGNKENEDSVAWLIIRILDYIKILGPSIMVLLTGVDYIRIVLFGDDELNKKMRKRLIIRFVCVGLLFFIPMLVEILLDLFGLTGCSSIY